MDDKNSQTLTEKFIKNLEKLEAGDRARLKRNAGNLINESNQVLGLFYKLLPFEVPKYQEEKYFMAATLFPLAEGGGSGDLGSTLRKVRIPGKNEKGLDRRFQNILDAEKLQLPFRLRQMIHLLHSNRIKVDWLQMLEDLIHWDHPEKYVQKKWARSYYSKTDKKE